MLAATRLHGWLSVSETLSVHNRHCSRPSLSIVCGRHYSSSGSKKRVLPKMSLPEIPNVSSVSSRVIRVLGCNPGFMTLQGTNTYVVGTGQRRILIDAGEPNFPEYIRNLQETMIKHNFQLDHIIITHYHRDHIGGVDNVLDMITNKNECKVWKFHSSKTKPRKYNFPLNFLENEQKFHIEGATLKIYHTPGHTADHAIINLEEDNSLFSADCVLGEGTTVFENLKEYLNSLQLILDLKPALILPGHGSVVKDPITRVNNYIKHRLERELEIYNLINTSQDGSMSEEDIVNVMYKFPSNDYKEAATYVIQRHLLKLVEDDKIVQNNDKWEIKKKTNL